jgi:archaeal flagellar protein FlaJ
MPATATDGYLPHPVPEEVQHLITRQPRSRAATLRLYAYIVSGAIAAALLALSALTFMGRMSWPSLYGTDLLLLASIVALGPFGTFFLRDLRRQQAIDNHFPDFLRDLAESARGGMTLPRALQSAARGQYGALTPEIQRMSHQVEWGIRFGDAFQRFAERADTPLITRTVNLIQEARRSGGNMVDVLTAAAEDAREIKQIVEQRQNQMRSYTTVIYVTFGVFLFVMLLVQAQLVPAFARAAEAAGGGASFGGISLSATDETLLNETFFHAALIQAFTGGLIAGLLRRGSPLAGLPAMAIMTGIAWLCFRFGVPLLARVLGS